MSWTFGHREVRGWGCNGLFDEDDNMILGDDTGWSGGFVMPSETHQRQIEAVPEMLELLQRAANIMASLERLLDTALMGQASVDKAAWDSDVVALLSKIEGGGN